MTLLATWSTPRILGVAPWCPLCTPGGMLLRTDAAFCAYLLREHHVAVVPGGVLGLAPYFRISYAASTADLQEACTRIQRACQALF